MSKLVKAGIAQEWQYPRLRFGQTLLFLSHQDDLPIYDLDEVMVACDFNGGAGRNISGFVAPNKFAYAKTPVLEAEGWPGDVTVRTGVARPLWIFNWWVQPISLLHLNAGSAVGNRIRTTSAATVVLTAKKWGILFYSPHDTEWELVFPPA